MRRPRGASGLEGPAAASEPVAAVEVRGNGPGTHQLAILTDEADASLGAIEYDLVVAHCSGANDRAIAVIVVHAHTPNSILPLVRVLRWRYLEAHTVCEFEAIGLELLEFIHAHPVTVVIAILTLDRARRARAPRADRSPAIARLRVRARRQVSEGCA
jgi:hypothetical protein